MAKSRHELAEVLAQNRRAAQGLIGSTSKKALRETLERTAMDLQKRLTQVEGLAAAGKGIPFTEERLRLTLRQVQDVLKLTKYGLKNVLIDAASIAADKSTKGLLDYLETAEKQFSGLAQPLAIDQAAVLTRAKTGVDSSLLHRIETDPNHPGKVGVLQRYGAATLQTFEDVMRRGLLARQDWADVRNDLIAESPFLQGAPAFWAERILRTESMHAYNRAGWEGMREADDQLGDMLKILSAVFDDRTGWDSYQVHGQIRRVQEAFTFNGPNGVVNYQHPPNRPNDREVVVPHRMSWPLPDELRALDDGAVVAAWVREGRKGAPPPRPPMSTVDIKLIGAAPTPAPRPEEPAAPLNVENWANVPQTARTRVKDAIAYTANNDVGQEYALSHLGVSFTRSTTPFDAMAYNEREKARSLLIDKSRELEIAINAGKAPTPSTVAMRDVVLRHGTSTIASEVEAMIGNSAALSRPTTLIKYGDRYYSKHGTTNVVAAAAQDVKRLRAYVIDMDAALTDAGLDPKLTGKPKIVTPADGLEEVKAAKVAKAAAEKAAAEAKIAAEKAAKVAAEKAAAEAAKQAAEAAKQAAQQTAMAKAAAAGYEEARAKHPTAQMSPGEKAKWYAEQARARLRDMREGTFEGSTNSSQLPPGYATEHAYRSAVDDRMNTLPADCQKAIRRFTHQYDYAIRALERGMSREDLLASVREHRKKHPWGDYEDTPEEHVEIAARAAADIERAFAQTKPVPGTVYRGIGDLSEDTFNRFVVDDVMRLGATSSTSRDRYTARSFMKTDETPRTILLEIKQDSAIPIETISRYGNEKELLMHKQTVLRVVERVKLSYTSVLLRCVAEAPKPADPTTQPAKKTRRKKAST